MVAGSSLKLILYYCLGAGYEARLSISLSGDLEPLKSDLRRLRFFIFGLVGNKQPNFLILTPNEPQNTLKNREKIPQVFDAKTGCQKLHFMIFFNAKSDKF